MAVDLMAPPTEAELAATANLDNGLAPPTAAELAATAYLDKPPVKNHDFIPAVKSAASDLYQGAKNVAAGAGQRIMDPVGTAKEMGQAVASGLDDQVGTAKGAYRAVRNIPGVGSAINDTVASGHALAADVGEIARGGNDGSVGQRAKDSYLAEQRQEDDAHAQAHPITDFVQRSVGFALPIPQSHLVAQASADVFKKSMEEGNSAYDSFRDARNAAALFGIAHAAGSVLPGEGTPAKLKGMAEDRALKTATGQNVAAVRGASQMSSQGSANPMQALENRRAVGRRILDTEVADPSRPSGTARVLAAGDSTAGIAPKADQAFQTAKGDLGTIEKGIDQRVPQGAVSGKNIADKIVDYASTLYENPDNGKMIDNLLAHAKDFEDRGTLSFQDGVKAKNAFKYDAAKPDSFISNQDASNAVRGIISKELETTAAQYPEGAGYKDAKERFGAFKEVNKATSKRSSQDLANRVVSPSDYGIAGAVGAGGIASGHEAIGALAAAAAGAANHVARLHGSSVAARSLDNLSKVLTAVGDRLPAPIQKTLIEAAGRSPDLLLLNHQLLMKSNPDYRAIMEGQQQ